MRYRLTVLCENCAGPIAGTLGEHGFAALIEGEGFSLLFDTGQGLTLLHNAERMNKDLARVQGVALSHGHYDHCGGLVPLLRVFGAKIILAHPGVFAPRFRYKDTGESLSIGMRETEDSLREMGADFDLSVEFREIAPGLFLTGEIPRSSSFETGDDRLFSDPVGATVDAVMDDQSLVIKTDRGLVLLLGCCHGGLINTLALARERTGVEKFRAVIGGTHLGFSSPSQIERTVQALVSYNVERICVSHCTGFAASVRLQREFPAAFQSAHVGYTIEL